MGIIDTEGEMGEMTGEIGCVTDAEIGKAGRRAR